VRVRMILGFGVCESARPMGTSPEGGRKVGDYMGSVRCMG
jgi:hypothetical protein